MENRLKHLRLFIFLSGLCSIEFFILIILFGSSLIIKLSLLIFILLIQSFTLFINGLINPYNSQLIKKFEIISSLILLFLGLLSFIIIFYNFNLTLLFIMIGIIILKISMLIISVINENWKKILKIWIDIETIFSLFILTLIFFSLEISNEFHGFLISLILLIGGISFIINSLSMKKSI